MYVVNSVHKGTKALSTMHYNNKVVQWSCHASGFILLYGLCGDSTTTSSFAKKKKPVDFDDELKTGDVRYDNLTFFLKTGFLLLDHLFWIADNS